jgi:hypothetical protein
MRVVPRKVTVDSFFAAIEAASRRRGGPAAGVDLHAQERRLSAALILARVTLADLAAFDDAFVRKREPA